MTSHPLVSVIIPCYNAQATLAHTIASVRAQTYPNIEIIAVDDGSRDGTLALLDGLRAADLRVMSQPNAGAAAARNTAIAVAKGEVLAFLDADDSWHSDKITRQMAVFAANPRVVLVGCRAEVDSLNGTRHKVNPTRQPPIGPFAWRTLLHHSFYVPSVVAARTDVVRRIGGFTARMRAGEEDQDFAIRMALAGEVGFVDADLTIMHQQPGSLSLKHLAREHLTVLPMILDHCRALSDRLSRTEMRSILGARYAQIGRNIYPIDPGPGLRLLLKAMFYGNDRFGNLLYLLSAAPPSRRVKRMLRLNRDRA